MDANLYIKILKTLLPFTQENFQDHLLMLDNDLKHMLLKAWQFVAHNSMNWWKQELIDGIEEY